MTIVAIPLFGTTWYAARGPILAVAGRASFFMLLPVVSACYLTLYALILWDDHKRNGYSPAFWITAGVLAVITVTSVLNALLSKREPLTRIHRIGNPILRNTAGILRLLTVIVMWLLTPGLYLVALFETVRAYPSNERAARADLAAQLAAHEHRGARREHVTLGFWSRSLIRHEFGEGSPQDTRHIRLLTEFLQLPKKTPLHICAQRQRSQRRQKPL